MPIIFLIRRKCYSLLPFECLNLLKSFRSLLQLVYMPCECTCVSLFVTFFLFEIYLLHVNFFCACTVIFFNLLYLCCSFSLYEFAILSPYVVGRKQIILLLTRVMGLLQLCRSHFRWCLLEGAQWGSRCGWMFVCAIKCHWASFLCFKGDWVQLTLIIHKNSLNCLCWWEIASFFLWVVLLI